MNADVDIAAIHTALRQGAEAELYKRDRRSRVWRIDIPTGPVVIKRFEHHPLRQLLAWLLRVHPAQREARAAARLQRAGFPVVPIIARGVQRSTLGCRAWLATPYAGEPILERPHPNPRQLAQHVGHLVGRLIASGWFFKDCKTTNILINEAGELHLIDVGSARRRRPTDDPLRMLTLLNETATARAATRTNRLRALRALLTAAPTLGELKPLARTIENRTPRPSSR